MKKTIKIICAFLMLIIAMNGFSANTAFAATAKDKEEYDKSQYSGELTVTGAPTISFIKKDGTTIDWDNPIVSNDGATFGFRAIYDLENVEEIITQVSEGNIGGIPSELLPLISMFKESALISGSFDLVLDLNAGLRDYFTFNQDSLTLLKANPNSLFQNNEAYLKIFDVASVDETAGVLTISVSVKSGITGANILALAADFDTLDFTILDLFELNPLIWDDVDNINKGEFKRLVSIEAPATIFIVSIPQIIITIATNLGIDLKNPFVGVELLVGGTTGALNLGYIVSYDGNGSDEGEPPVDIIMPYNDEDRVTILGRNTLKKEGHKFIGWSIDQVTDENSILYQKDDTFVITSNTILYAQWKECDLYSVIYDGNGHDGGEVPVDSEEYEENDVVTVLSETMTKEGYIFKGWNYEGKTYLKNETFNMPPTDVMLTAVWEENIIIENDKEKEDNNNTTIKTKNPSTGDTSSPFFWSILLISSFGIVMHYKKKYYQERS